MKRIVSLILLYVCGCFVSSATISTSAGCGNSGTLAYGGSSGIGTDSASCTSEISIPALGDTYVTITEASIIGSISPSSVSFTASGGDNGGWYPLDIPTMSVSGDAELTLTTDGPIRQGYITFNETGFLVGGSGNVSFMVDSYSENCDLPPSLPLVCNGAFGSSGPGPLNKFSGTLPFTLGQQFTFSESFQAGGSERVIGFPYGGVGMTFQLTDASGNPVEVQVAPTPEPATKVLSGIGLVFVGLKVLGCWRRQAVA